MAILVDGFHPSALMTPMQILSSADPQDVESSLSITVNVRVVHLGRERDLRSAQWTPLPAHRGRLEGEVGAEDDVDGELAADVGRALGSVELDLPVEEVVAVDLDVDPLERLVGEFLEFLISACASWAMCIPSGLAVCCLQRTWWIARGWSVLLAEKEDARSLCGVRCVL